MDVAELRPQATIPNDDVGGWLVWCERVKSALGKSDEREGHGKELGERGGEARQF